MDLVTQYRRVLEAPLLRSLLHLRLQLARHGTALGAEEAQEPIDVASVALLAHAVRARRGALPDGMQQARPEAAVGRIIRLDVELAGAVLEHALHERDGAAQRMHAGERAEDARTRESLVGGVAGHVDAGELLAHRHRQVRKRLVVAKQFVEPRLDVLDQPALEEECLPLGLALQELEVRHHVEHRLLARTEVRAGHEVTRDPVGQAGGLAHVEHRPRRVLHQVHAGNLGQRPGLLGQLPEAVWRGFFRHRRNPRGFRALRLRILREHAHSGVRTDHPLFQEISP